MTVFQLITPLFEGFAIHSGTIHIRLLVRLNRRVANGGPVLDSELVYRVVGLLVVLLLDLWLARTKLVPRGARW